MQESGENQEFLLQSNILKILSLISIKAVTEYLVNYLPLKYDTNPIYTYICLYILLMCMYVCVHESVCVLT